MSAPASEPPAVPPASAPPADAGPAATAATARDQAGPRQRRGRGNAARAGAGLAILAVWQAGAAAFAPGYVARPSGVAAAIGPVLGDPRFLSAAGSTLLAVVEGLAIAVAAGTAAGLVMGRVRDVDRALRLYVNSFYAMPLVALVPLLTVWFGYTPAARLAVIVLEAVLPVAFSAAEGGRTVPGDYLEVAAVYRAPWWRIWLGVALPASVPHLLAGLDLAIGRALIGAVVAEFIAGLNGLGYFVLFQVRSFHEDQAMVAVAVLVAFALAARAGVNAAVRRGLPWYRAV